MDLIHKKIRPGPTTLIVVSLLAGVACGLFFGEYCAVIRWAGDAFIGLLQMAVLPYITVSLVANTGRLSLAKAGRLVRVSVVTLAALWLLGLTTVLLLGQAFPVWQTGSFYSTSFVDEPESVHFVELFVPANPFHALANNVIPAVVVFSLGLGVALMGMPNKDGLLQNLDVIAKALSRLNHFVVRLAPVGVFAIVANAVGTVPFEQFELLQAYLITITAGALILVFGVLPTLISLTTPIGYWESIRVSRDALITAFVLGNTFAVIPLIIDASREVLENHNLLSEGGSSPDALVPLAFPFPDLGRIARLVFIPFASWFYGHSLELMEYAKLLALGVAGCFAKLTITIPWLLGFFHIPEDIFQLYLLAEVYTTRLGDLLKTSHLLAFAILVSCALGGGMKIRWRRLFISIVAFAVLSIVVVGGIRLALTWSFQEGHRKDDLLVERGLLLPAAPSEFLEQPVTLTDVPIEGESLLDRIRRRGKIRVGVDADALPFSYFNKDGQLVGFDIEMAHQLAMDLGVEIQFALYDSETLAEQMDAGLFDIVMAGLEGTVERAAELMLTEPYMDVTLAVVVPDYRRREFQRLDSHERSGLTVAVVRGGFLAYELRKNLPDTRIVELDSERDFFRGQAPQCEVLVTSAETGSAWTLLYPQYSVVNPLEKPIRIPLYYAIAPDTRFRKFLEVWLKLKQRDGTTEQLYDYWVLGLRVLPDEPRWCIMRDVLGWVE